jgi:hypothetical protein
MANPKTPGDLFFEQYCDLNGYLTFYDPVNDPSVDIDGTKEPDYLIDRAGDRALVEVKHFTTMRQKEQLMASPGKALSFGGRQLYGTLKTSIRAGGEQLEPFVALGVPLVVVVTDPRHSDVSLDRDDVVSALFGEVKWTVGPGVGHVSSVYSRKDAAVLHTEPNGDVVNRLPHLSAVVALYGLDAFPRVDVYDLSGAPDFGGTPLPRVMFDAEGDAWLGFVDSDTFSALPTDSP